MSQEPLSFQAKIYFPLLATNNNKSIHEVLLAGAALSPKDIKATQARLPTPQD